MNHSRIYTMALATLAAFAAASAAFLFSGILDGADSIRALLLPAWEFPLIGIVNLAYALVITATLCIRVWRPERARVSTCVLNWLLLPAFPGGTAVGLYGLFFIKRSFSASQRRSVEVS